MAWNGLVKLLKNETAKKLYHEYAESIPIIGEWVENGEYPNDEKALKSIVEGICHNNAAEYFEF